MRSRSCGYCGNAGHRRPICPDLHKQRRQVYEGTVQMRHSIYRLLHEQGWGQGALIEYTEFGRGRRRGFIAEIEKCIPEWNRYRFSNVKYSKRVILQDCDMLNDNGSNRSIQIPVIPLDGPPRYVMITARTLRYNNEWDWMQPPALLVPMNDEYEFDEAIWSRHIFIDKRLALPQETNGNNYSSYPMLGELNI